MDALEILRQQHVEAKSAFQQIESSTGDRCMELWRKLEPELKMHEQVEERCVYDPVAQQLSNDQMLQNWHREHHEEVGQAEQMISRIDGLQGHDDQWMQMVRQLHQTLDHHIQEEEGRIWPHIRQVWSDHLDHAGQQIEQMKSQGMGRAA